MDFKGDVPAKPHGNLTMLTATVFILGEVAGGKLIRFH